MRRGGRGAKEIGELRVIRTGRDGAVIGESRARYREAQESIVAAVWTHEIRLLSEFGRLRFPGDVEQNRIAAGRREILQKRRRRSAGNGVWEKCRGHCGSARSARMALQRAAVGCEIVNRTSSAIIFNCDLDTPRRRAAEQANLNIQRFLCAVGGCIGGVVNYYYFLGGPGPPAPAAARCGFLISLWGDVISRGARNAHAP